MKKQVMKKTSFDADPETVAAMKIVIEKLGRGNKSEGIRRAIIQAAEAIQLTNSLKVMDKVTK
jgi:hypothetical protein